MGTKQLKGLRHMVRIGHLNLSQKFCLGMCELMLGLQLMIEPFQLWFVLSRTRGLGFWATNTV